MLASGHGLSYLSMKTATPPMILCGQHSVVAIFICKYNRHVCCEKHQVLFVGLSQS